MNKNVKIAKELVRLAKSLVGAHRVDATYSLKHPFSLTKNSQGINEVYDALKDGKDCDAVIMKGTQKEESETYSNGDSYTYRTFIVIKNGVLICCKNLEDKKNKILKEIKRNDHENGMRMDVYNDKWKYRCGRNGLSAPKKGFSPNVSEIQVDGERIRVFWEIE